MQEYEYIKYLLISKHFGFNYFQVSLQLDVFSYLDAETLCQVASTCKYWHIISEDKVLWSNLLRDDVKKWTTINHLSYPLTYEEANTELSPKQMYVQIKFKNKKKLFQTDCLIEIFEFNFIQNACNLQTYVGESNYF